MRDNILRRSLMTRFEVFAFAGFFCLAGVARAQGVLPPVPRTCGEVTLTHPKVGSAFNGRATNDDYHFSVQVPHGFTGWSGTATSAPFHGFTIFLGSDTSCIVFEIHIRVDEENVEPRPVNVRLVSLGKAAGWQATVRGTRDGLELENVITSFSFAQPDQTDDGSVVLVTNARDKGRYLRIYNEFLSSLKFGR
jgi:hypothetical protein